MTTTQKDVNDYVISSYISDNDDEFAQTKTYYCNYCKTKLSYNGKEPNTRKNEFLCTRCNITFYPDDELVRKANKFETPGEQELLNATVDSDDNISVPASGYFAQQKLPPSFEMLKKRGFNFTHYEQH
jgi:hypothetical protein